MHVNAVEIPMSNTAEVFQNMNDRITPEKAKKINSTYLFDITGEGKWFADLTKEGGPYITPATEGQEAKCVVTVAKADDWIAIATGKMNPTSAFMGGKIKVKGDMSLAMKLQSLLT
jgi:predicted lipid carrier protein YhbT